VWLRTFKLSTANRIELDGVNAELLAWIYLIFPALDSTRIKSFFNLSLLAAEAGANHGRNTMKGR